jgi:hypothetical protein
MLPPPPPPPTAITETEVTPAGATQEKVPAVVNVAQVAKGVKLAEAAESGPVPAPFVARTLNVYAVPVVNPLTVTGEEAPVPVIQPGEEIAVYPVMAALPVQDGAVKATEAAVAEA